MRHKRQHRWPAWLAVAALPVFAGTQAPEGVRICRSGSVEMIVGGATSPAASCAAPGPTTPIANASRGASGHRVRLDEGGAERRSILEEELSREQAVLNSLLKAGPAADSAMLARTQSNIAALRQELARANP
ncbi:MAG TPA: hypothetical protein VFY73_11665 [Ideonella sp.]|jgi:hypothetical protein|uniref:hypothetical protein n=1 Tax=Ideonella sp. TaxID=1929293 RepID=UPI002E2EAA6C|nr:hypothetical protein [Ideonella sp.]HEX5684678.1 hypothetical protein [Ideonella sp.]